MFPEEDKNMRLVDRVLVKMRPELEQAGIVFIETTVGWYGKDVTYVDKKALKKLFNTNKELLEKYHLLRKRSLAGSKGAETRERNKIAAEQELATRQAEERLALERQREIQRRETTLKSNFERIQRARENMMENLRKLDRKESELKEIQPGDPVDVMYMYFSSEGVWINYV